ncbi:hypothetical protein [Actinomadura rubrisoli]|nr:hypothetical protein [Actinomadura rubrisoli]
MAKITFTGPIDIETDLDWTKEPVFEFETEVDALQTLQFLGEDLKAAREQVRHIMRYMDAAVRAARHNGEGDTQPQAIINHSGLARQTVYNMLGESNEVQ